MLHSYINQSVNDIYYTKRNLIYSGIYKFIFFFSSLMKASTAVIRSACLLSSLMLFSCSLTISAAWSAAVRGSCRFCSCMFFYHLHNWLLPTRAVGIGSCVSRHLPLGIFFGRRCYSLWSASFMFTDASVKKITTYYLWILNRKVT